MRVYRQQRARPGNVFAGDFVGRHFLLGGEGEKSAKDPRKRIEWQDFHANHAPLVCKLSVFYSVIYSIELSVF